MTQPTKATEVLASDARTSGLARRLGAVDRILSPVDGMTVVNEPHNPTPAWTDGEHIWLNKAALPELDNLDSEAIVTWLGANHHEIGHSLYSPRSNSPLMKEIKKLENEGMFNGIRRIENLIEDQRQERLLIARFHAWRTHLTTAALRIIIQGVGDREMPPVGALWPWIVGRTWLPADIRAKSKADWDGDGAELAQLVGRYQHLGDPGEMDVDDALSILKDIWTCLRDGDEDVDQMPTGCQPGPGTKVLMGEDPDVLHADDDVVPAAGSDEDNDQLDEAEAEEQGDSSDTDGQGDDDTAGTEEGEGAGSDDGEDGEGDAGNDGMPPSADETPEASDSGTTPSPSDDAVSQIADALSKQVKQQLKENPDVQRDVDQIKASLEDLGQDNSALPDSGVDPRAPKYVDAPPEARRLAREVGDSLRHLTDETLPYWRRRVDRGKLNVGRFMRRQAGDRLDTMFDEFRQGMQDEVSLDVTILVDTSTSMGDRGTYLDPNTGQNAELTRKIESARQATWALQRAVEAAEGDCTVIEFDDTARLVSQTGRHPHPTKMRNLRASANTNPSDALSDTWQRLQSVEATHKVVVIISDGQWYRGGDLVKDMAASGVITVGVQLEYYVTTPPVHLAHLSAAQLALSMENQHDAMKRRSETMGCEHTLITEDCRDMVELFKELVTVEMTKAMNQAVHV